MIESHLSFLDGPHIADAEADFGLRPMRDRRKVVLWSRKPWRDIDRIGSPTLPPGRFVEGVTETPLGLLRVIGVCVPWSMAHVSSGRRDRSPWDEHRVYLKGLRAIVKRERQRSTLLLGDFNQTLARTRAPRDAWEHLTNIFADGFAVGTGSSDAIDHCAVRGGIAISDLRMLDNVLEDGTPLSDHTGVVFRISKA